MYRILIVEDNEKIRMELCDFLSKNGYLSEGCSNFQHILEDITSRKPDLILLDLNLPFTDGHFICKELRKTSNVPIIIVTSRNSEIDELQSMHLGADDYVTKPYNLQILLARIARVLQRVYESKDSNHMKVGKVTMDISKSTLSYLNKSVDLTKNELRILHCLMQNKKLPQTLQLLYQALDMRRCLDFTYCKFDLDGQQRPVRRYERILPLKVVWEKEHYYLIALNPAHPEENQQRNYRVDRMTELSISVPYWKKVSSKPLNYGQFGMFPAQESCWATFRLHRDLLDMAFEILGTDIRPVPDEEKENWVRFTEEVELSTGFERWLLGQADKIEVLGPPAVRDRIRNRLMTICDYYRQ